MSQRLHPLRLICRFALWRQVPTCSPEPTVGLFSLRDPRSRGFDGDRRRYWQTVGAAPPLDIFAHKLAVAGGGDGSAPPRRGSETDVRHSSARYPAGSLDTGEKKTKKTPKTFIQPRFKLCPNPVGLITRWMDIPSGVPGYGIMGTGMNWGIRRE